MRGPTWRKALLWGALLGSLGTLWGQPLRVLFLGGVGNSHRSDSMNLLLSPALMAYGIQMHYTEDATALNRDHLAGFAALYLFHELGGKVGEAQVAALAEFVRGGKGVVACHVGISTARTDPVLDTVFGGRFVRHGNATFTPEIVLPGHPAMDGVVPFSAQDETYEHRATGSGRTVLMVRRAVDKPPEPWTWVRTEGKGRVYYTASGHGSNVWILPAFQKQIAVALRWAAPPGISTGIRITPRQRISGFGPACGPPGSAASHPWFLSPAQGKVPVFRDLRGRDYGMRYGATIK